ncbi:NAD(P)-binding protein [Obba rivulosa]|uniref:NAD(P)-binding protein n=1 Tax=Obba rivulosa TaxID=1052685 RepID=A0A8E2AKX5_9APHY|nr:NAD(P)-binding protein [Obba rivulosa]
MAAPKVWLITGASTGFGRLMAELALEKGDTVIATLRRPEVLAELAAKYTSSQLLVLKLDVKRPDEVTAAFTQAQESFGRIDVVFNNAGYAAVSEVESAQGHEDVVRDMFEVNFWGAVHVTQSAVRYFREVNNPAGGRLLQMSSLAGIEGAPAAGFYCASKFALEGLSEALAKELHPSWNIKVTIIDPGPFRTTAHLNVIALPQHPAYVDTAAAAGRIYMRQDVADDARKAVLKLYELVDLPEPPLHLPIGKSAVESLRRKAADLSTDADAYASWSEGLELAE